MRKSLVLVKDQRQIDGTHKRIEVGVLGIQEKNLVYENQVQIIEKLSQQRFPQFNSESVPELIPESKAHAII